jgi:hypothetical protein
VHPGSYASFTVTFGLDIVAPQPGVLVSGASILNVPAQQVVRLDGLNIFGPTFLVRGCAGSVHLHGLATTFCHSSIENSARVALTVCRFNGGGVPGDAGLLLVSASAVLDFCFLSGSAGAPWTGGPGFATGGGDALVLQGSTAFLNQCTATGGAGANANLLSNPGPGGNGASGDAASQLCAVGNSAFVGGAAGSSGGLWPPSSPGVGIAPGSLMALRLAPAVQYTPAGTPFTAIPDPPQLHAPILLLSGSIAAIQVTNTANQAVLLGIDLRNDLIRIPGVELPFVLTTAASLYAFAPPTAASSVSFSLPVPSAPWLLQQFVHMQGVTVTGNGALQCSTGGYSRII